MGFFDFIGNKPNQLSLAEILSAVPAIAGPALMQRGGRIGLPLGMGLTAFGGLGQELAQKREKQQQRQSLADSLGQMPGVTDKQRQFFGQMAQSGVNPETFLPEVMKSIFPTTKQSTGPRELAAGALGLPLDSSKWSTKNYQDVADWETKFKLAGEKPPETEASKLDLHTKEKQIDQQYQKPPFSWRNTTDATGRTIQEPYTAHFDPVTHKMVAEKVPIEGEPEGLPAALDATTKKQVLSVENARAEFPILTNIIKQLPPTSTATLQMEHARYISKGVLGAVDPRYAAYFAQIGQLKGDLLQAASGGRQSVPLMNYVKDHIPNETDPPALTQEKMDSFDVGRFNALLKNALGTGTPEGAAATANANAATPPKPPFEVDKVYQKDGNWYVREKGTGKFYQSDGSKWAPL